MKYTLLLFVFSCAFVFTDESTTDIQKLKASYKQDLEAIREFHWKYAREKIEAYKKEALKNSRKKIIDAWLKEIILIEDLDSKGQYEIILSRLNIFDDKKIEGIHQDKERLKTHYTELLKIYNQQVKRGQEVEQQILKEQWSLELKNFVAANQVPFGLKIYKQLLVAFPDLGNNPTLKAKGDALIVLNATREQAIEMLRQKIGKEIKLRGIIKTIESIEDEKMILIYPNGEKKEFPLANLHLVDWLGISGLRFFDPEWVYRDGLRLFLEEKYTKAFDKFQFCEAKGLTTSPFNEICQTHLDQTERNAVKKCAEILETQPAQQAETALKIQIKKYPENRALIFMLATCYQNQGLKSKVWSLLIPHKKEFMDDFEYRDLMLSTAQSLKNYSDADEWAKIILEHDETHKDALQILCSNTKRKDKFIEHLKYAKQYHHYHQDSLDAQYTLAEAYYVNEDHLNALLIYDEILKKDDQNWKAIQGKGKNLYAQKEYKKNLEFFEGALAKITSESRKNWLRKKIKDLLERF